MYYNFIAKIAMNYVESEARKVGKNVFILASYRGARRGCYTARLVDLI